MKLIFTNKWANGTEYTNEYTNEDIAILVNNTKNKPINTDGLKIRYASSTGTIISLVLSSIVKHTHEDAEELAECLKTGILNDKTYWIAYMSEEKIYGEIPEIEDAIFKRETAEK